MTRFFEYLTEGLAPSVGEWIKENLLVGLWVTGLIVAFVVAAEFFGSPLGLLVPTGYLVLSGLGLVLYFDYREWARRNPPKEAGIDA